jgi:hypothetical protein
VASATSEGLEARNALGSADPGTVHLSPVRLLLITASHAPARDVLKQKLESVERGVSNCDRPGWQAMVDNGLVPAYSIPLYDFLTAHGNPEATRQLRYFKQGGANLVRDP